MMKRFLLLPALLLAAQFTFAQPVGIGWVGRQPSFTTGETWGVPFPKGAYTDGQQFVLRDPAGETVPSQQWVMARHGDGSIKWLGVAASVSPSQKGGFTLEAMKLKKKDLKALPQGRVSVTESEDGFTVCNGVQTIVFAKTGRQLVKSVLMGGTLISDGMRLVLQREARLPGNAIEYQDFASKIENVVVEKSGPVLAVIKVDGCHTDGTRSWLPFTVRFYISSGAAPVKMVHTVIYDGDQDKDFIKGLGVEFSLCLREEQHNRHVSFVTENGGLWSESVKPLAGRRRLRVPGQEGGRDYLAEQVAGARVPDKAGFDAAGRKLIDDWADWDGFRLTQLNPDGFDIRKRANPDSRWIGTAGGGKAAGFVQAGDVSGGLGLSVKDFWQSYPKELEVGGMTLDKGRITAWIWSPLAEAMDMRHYDTEGHGLDSAYEDYQEGMSTPYGVSRTTELTFIPYTALPSRQERVDMAEDLQAVSLLMPSPQYLHDAGAFGIWGLPDPQGNDTRQWMESMMDKYIAYYGQSVRTQRWYGFWDYGDFMHSYTPGRHLWNYDMGGFAWDNTELETPLWLWYSFIRSGREDIFRLAEAMTRHTSEVDVYHIGKMAGLGTRHNVSHWGCGAKEARVAQAWWHRIYYYLTTDERVGDLMHEVRDGDYTTLEFDPLRVAQPRSEFPTSQPTRLRWGPDWIAFVGNWYTEWERFGDAKYHDKIIAGMESLSHLPNGLFTGKGPYGYDPQTGVLTYEGDPDWVTNSNHLANIQGGMEVMLEVYDGIGYKPFNDTFVEYASWYGVPQDDPVRSLPENKKYERWWGHWNVPRLLAFAGVKAGDDYRVNLAWHRFLDGVVDASHKPFDMVASKTIGGADAPEPFEEAPGVSTNGVAQWNLDAIIMLGLAGDKVPPLSELKPRDVARFGPPDVRR